MNVTQALTGQTIPLTLTTYTAGSQVDQGTFTIGIVDANGTEVVASGTAVTDNSDGTYEYSLAAQTNPRFLIATWTESGGTTYRTFVEVSRNALFTETEAREFTVSGLQKPLASDTTYPASEIDRVRSLVTAQFEQRTRRAWTRRYCRMEFTSCHAGALNVYDGIPRDYLGNASGGPGRNKPARIIAATCDDVAQDADDLSVDGIYFRNESGWSGDVVVEFEYGDDPVDYEVNHHALKVAVATLVPSDVSGYAQTFQGADGIVNYGNTLAWPMSVWDWFKQHPKPPFVL